MDQKQQIVEMKGIYKSFLGVDVLRGVNFSVNRGEVMALCGENGAGKSTLMKLLAGIYKADKGTIEFDGSILGNNDPLHSREIGISMIHQELNLISELSVAQNIFLGREPKTKLGMIDFQKMEEDSAYYLRELKEEIDVKLPVGSLKIAQRQMVEIARSISSNSKLIIMDEPTAVLTEKETEILFDTIRNLKQKGVSIIYISHRLQEIRNICDRVTILRDGIMIVTKKTNEISEAEIAALMVGRQLSDVKTEPFRGNPEDIVLEVRHVRDQLLKDVSFRVCKGEIVGFSGLIGSGRTELMEYIFGLRKGTKGEILLGGKKIENRNPAAAIRRGIGFSTEDRKASGIIGIRSIAENANYGYLVKTSGGWVHKKVISENTQKMIDMLRIVCVSQKQLIQHLSGGNQQKIILGRWILVDSQILILDEPTRGIDVGSREEIYQIIFDMAKQGKTILIISSDLPEIIKVCPKVFVMYEGKLMGELSGSDRTEEKIITLASGLVSEEEKCLKARENYG